MIMEAEVRIELTHRSFAGHGITTLLPGHNHVEIITFYNFLVKFLLIFFILFLIFILLF